VNHECIRLPLDDNPLTGCIHFYCPVPMENSDLQTAIKLGVFILAEKFQICSGIRVPQSSQRQPSGHTKTMSGQAR
jgi:hypothetical protein